MSDPRNPPLDEEDDLGTEIEDADEGDEGEGDALDAGDADGEDEGQEQDEGEEEDVEVRPRGRARDTIRNLRQRARDAERRVAEFERGAQRPQPQPAVDPAELARRDREELERISMLPPFEMAEALDRRNQQRVAQAELRGFDRSDSAAFAAMCRNDKTAARLAPQVEAILASRRANGDYTLGRENIYHFLLGQEVAQRRQQQPPRQRQQAGRRVQAQTVRPRRAQGDVSTGRRARDEAAEREARLKNATLGDVW